MEFSTLYTLGFIESINLKNKKVLEVGCGGGELSAALMKQGVNIVAIDTDADSICIARQKGVRAVKKHFTEISENFDVLLFTRSLHHMVELGCVISHAKNILNKGGCLVLEEFSYTEMNALTATWFYGHLLTLQRAGRLRTNVSAREDSLTNWKEMHDEEPPLNSGGKMIKEIKSKFDIIEKHKAPYLFRYFEEMLIANDNKKKIVTELYEDEVTQIKANQILPIGLRIIAWK